MKKRKFIIIIVGIFVLIYIMGVLLFSNRVIPNTYIDNYTFTYNIGFENAKDINVIVDGNDNKKVTLTLPDKREAYFYLSQIKDDSHKTTLGKAVIKQQNKFLWPIEIFYYKHLSYDETYPINKEKLKGLLKNFGLEIGEPSQNAYINVKDNGEFYIEEEKYGTQIDIDKLADNIITEIYQRNFEIDINEASFKTAEITANNEDLLIKLDNIKKKISRDLTIDLVGATETVNAGYFYNTNKALEGTFEILNEKVDEYISTLANKYNTYGSQRLFTTHSGDVIYVGATGDLADDTYGFSLNHEETKNALYEALNNTQINNIAAIWNIKGNTRDDNGDIGNSYIEISIDEQKLWVFQDGREIYSTDVVTGLPTPNRHTPKGVYSMFNKGEDVNLKGELDGEKWDVDVDYWLSVTWTGVGIHSAPWQPSFGGDAYTYRGSHGCINVSTEAANWLYNNIDLGTCIVIY